MKYLTHTVLGVLFLSVVLSSLPQARGQSRDSSEASAELRIATSKSEDVLGEPVRLERLLIKIGDYTRVGFEPDDHGALGVFISKDGGEFLHYRFGGWDDLSNRPTSDGPGRYKLFHTILLNKKPETAHLSDYGRREAEKGMMLTDYAFPEPGEYRIKAKRIYTVRRGTATYGTSAFARSNEISIRVKEPEGDDLNVWEIMKSDPDIGYFMMVGDAPDRVPSIETTVLAKVDRITSQYPDSYLAGLLNVKAQEHRARRERQQREAERDRLKREQEKSSSAARKN